MMIHDRLRAVLFFAMEDIWVVSNMVWRIVIFIKHGEILKADVLIKIIRYLYIMVDAGLRCVMNGKMIL